MGTTIALIGGGVLLAAFAVWLAVRMARRRGRAEAERDRATAGLEQARRGHAIREDVERLSDADLDDELRNDSRD